MSLFETLKNAIFHHSSAATSSPSVNSQDRAGGSQPVPPASSATKPTPTANATAASGSTAPAAAGAVDVEAVLNGLNAKSQQKLNWRTSIVDLMKLVGMDPSLQHRKDLAAELGYKGDTNDSATMNIWLHKEVMKQLAANGGKVPADLQH